MDISAYSLTSAIVFFNIGLLFIKRFRHSTMFLMKNSTAALAILFLLSLVRVLFPFDLEHAVVVSSEKILPTINSIVGISIYKDISIGMVLLAIWFIGTISIVCKSLYVLLQEVQQIKKYRKIEDARIQKIAQECLERTTVVVSSPDVDIPKVMGIRKAYIYMPPLALSDEEIRLILLHEFQHVKGGDCQIKLFYLFLKAVFWWNPIVHIFQQEVENLLELRCDLTVTKGMSDEERVTYLEAILTVIKQVSLYETNPFIHATALADLKAQSFMQQRFEVILNQSVDDRKARNIRNICIIAIVFLCSYFIIVQPVYTPPENENFVEITDENAYIAIDGNGKLELYVNGEYFENVGYDV